jgi:CRISPR-associated endonuclease Cas2
MNKPAALYLATYDISLWRERIRVARLLSGYGVRVQKSVFEIRLTRADHGRLTRDIRGLDLKSGSVLLYRAIDTVAAENLGHPTETSITEGDQAWVLAE